jgi:hypothetical protein
MGRVRIPLEVKRASAKLTNVLKLKYGHVYSYISTLVDTGFLIVPNYPSGSYSDGAIVVPKRL